jgi:hypothetical protein
MDSGVVLGIILLATIAIVIVHALTTPAGR